MKKTSKEHKRKLAKAAQERWKKNHPGLAAQRTREWRLKNLDRVNARAREIDRKLRDEVFTEYGGYVCNCCGETEIMFLTIDHVDNNGAEHRRQLFGKNGRSGRKFYQWLKNNNYPKGFQVLCMNCNWGKARNGGECPHKSIEGSTTSRKAYTQMGGKAGVLEQED